MPRNILIHTRNLIIPGGKQSYLKALQAHFNNNVSYFFYGNQEPIKESLPGFIKRFFYDYVTFYRLLKKEKFDVVHINTSLNLKSFFRDSIFTLISTSLKFKTIVFWHGWRWDFEQKYGRKVRPFFRATFGKADAMICLAGEFVECLKGYGYNRPIHLESTLVEEQILAHEPIVPLASKNENTVILFLSRVEKEKGIYETIESFKNIQKSFPFTNLKIAGIGSELDNVKKFVANKKIDNIDFLGWVDGAEKLKVLSEADIFVLASYSEGMPICILEAMATGLPVVTTNIGGLKDFFEDAHMGYEVGIKDAGDLQLKLEKLIDNTQLRTKIGNSNVSYVRKYFSPKTVCDRLESIYESVIGESDIVSNWIDARK